MNSSLPTESSTKQPTSPHFALLPDNGFNAKFITLYQASLSDSKSEATTHAEVARRLGISYRNWLYQRKDPTYRIHADAMATLVALFKWDGSDLMWLYQ